MWAEDARLLIDDEARRLVRAGVVHAAPVAIAPASPALVEEMDRLAAHLAAEHAGRSPAGIPGLTAARELYRVFGIDPTRTRPSSEALLRRILAGKGLPRILNAVDVCTLCALRSLLPIGLYDAAAVAPPITLRRGRPGESYSGIRKDEVHLEGRPVLADAKGPFGNPTSDSLRTSIVEATHALVMVFFAPASCARSGMEGHVADAAASLSRHLAPPGDRVITTTDLCGFS